MTQLWANRAVNGVWMSILLFASFTADAAWTREQGLLIVNAHFIIADCAQRAPNASPGLRKAYDAWLEKQPAGMKEDQAKIATFLQSGPKDALDAHKKRYLAASHDELIEQCAALFALLEGKQEAEAPDPRRQSPCDAWQLFAEALGRQDFKTARKVVGGNASETLRTLISNSKAEHFADWANNLGSCSPGVSFGEFHEVTVVNKKNRASMVTLNWNGTNWIIVNM
jgi:hypothetical protein